MACGMLAAFAAFHANDGADWAASTLDACWVCQQWADAANAYAQAAAAEAWTTAVAQAAGPQVSSGGGGGWGFGDLVSAAKKSASAVAAGVDWCTSDTACTGSASIAIGVAGGFACAATAGVGCLAAVAVVGGGVALAGDARACKEGSNFSCGMAVADVVGTTAGIRQALTAKALVSQGAKSSVYRKLSGGEFYGGVGTALLRAGQRALGKAYWYVDDPWVQAPSLIYDFYSGIKVVLAKLRLILLYVVASKYRLALVGLALASIGLMILNIQFELAYVAGRTVALLTFAESVRSIRASRQKREGGK